MGGARRVPNDPRRRERILDATAEVISARGVHKTTHRRIAEQADVPLGSLTYYFDSLESLLEEAFQRLTESMSRRYRAALEAATDQEEACAAVAELICGEEYATAGELVLIFEMYSYANHNAAVAESARQWLARSQEALAVHFPPAACRAIDALIEAWPMHRSFEGSPLDREVVLATVTAIARHVR